MLPNLLAEFGIEIGRGLHRALRLAGRLSTDEAPEPPPQARLVVNGLADQIGAIQLQLARLDRASKLPVRLRRHLRHTRSALAIQRAINTGIAQSSSIALVTPPNIIGRGLWVIAGLAASLGRRHLRGLCAVAGHALRTRDLVVFVGLIALPVVTRIVITLDGFRGGGVLHRDGLQVDRA